MKRNNLAKTSIWAIAIIIIVILAFILLKVDVFYVQPSPTPSPSYTTPSAPAPTANPNTGEIYSFSIFQALRVVYTDESDQWFYPSSRTLLFPLTVMDRQTDKVVSNIQTYVYFNLKTSQPVSSVTFSADGIMETRGLDKNLIKNLGSRQITKTVYNPANGVDVSVVSSTLSSSDFEKYVGASAFPIRYYVIKLNDITAEVTFAEGNARIFGLTGVQATENQLWWRFQMYNSMQLISEGVEWAWT